MVVAEFRLFPQGIEQNAGRGAHAHRERVSHETGLDTLALRKCANNEQLYWYPEQNLCHANT